eukprot:PhM_4_TR12515/c0_g1_i2/m.14179/K08493/VTI1; vesicle transport through interaction with t-SNAREs 1
MSDETEILNKMRRDVEMQNSSIQRSTVTATATESAGVDALAELRRQRETLERTAAATQDTMTASSTARRVIDKLQVAEFQEKLLKILIILVLIATIIVLIKVKFL